MITFFMLLSVAVATLSWFLYFRSKVKKLETKLESQRQKREIDEGKRRELKQQLENAMKEVELQKAAVTRLNHQVHDPKEALALLTRIVESNEAEHPDD